MIDKWRNVLSYKAFYLYFMDTMFRRLMFQFSNMLMAQKCFYRYQNVTIINSYYPLEPVEC